MIPDDPPSNSAFEMEAYGQVFQASLLPFNYPGGIFLKIEIPSFWRKLPLITARVASIRRSLGSSTTS
jgi:hypothetical protein